MDRDDLGVVWYRFRATLGRRWRGYLTPLILIGWVGGIAMASVAAARRTQSSFATFLASTNPSDLLVSLSLSAPDATDSYLADVRSQVSHLAGVRQAESYVELNTAQLGPDGRPLINAMAQVARFGSVDGLFFNQDRLSVVRGRLADPKKADELVMTARAAQLLGLRVGDVMPWVFFTNGQVNAPGGGTPRVDQGLRLDVKVVGLVVLNNEVVQDDVDRLPTSAIFTPALTASLPHDSAVGGPSFIHYGLQLVHGSNDVAAVEQEFANLRLGYASFHLRSSVEAKVDHAVKPESIALGVFGGIAGLAALLIASQAISRQLRAGDLDLQVLRALGAGPSGTAGDGLIGILGAVVLGSVLAAGVAVGLSPLSPLGPARQFYPGSGIAFDWTVLSTGILVLTGGLSMTGGALSRRGLPHRVAQRSRAVPEHGSSVVRLASACGLPAPGIVGARFALEPGHGANAVPVRSALLGAVLTVVAVVATLTFGSSLRTLVSHPALYGWNWDYVLNGDPNVPPQAQALLSQDPDVAAWTGLRESNAVFEGRNVPVLLGGAHASPAPRVVSGHGLDGDGQVVLGAATLAQLHKRVGDSVIGSYGTPEDAPFYVPPTRLSIVGMATMPALGSAIAGEEHTEMGIGALLPTSFWPATYQQAFRQAQGADPTLNGPNLVLVRVRAGVRPAVGLADMQRIADAANRAFAAVPDQGGVGDTVAAQAVEHPAEIVNYRTLGTTPASLDAGLAAGAVIALGLTLASSVRRRRRDLALLRTFGFTTRQLRATVAWQASIAAVAGVGFGVPLGVALGRWLWILFARSIYAVPQPTVPVGQMALVAFGALILANIVAAIPGHTAARTPTALLLRIE